MASNRQMTFDIDLGQRGKIEGMERAALNRHALLAACRSALIKVALNRPDRTATADDAQRWLISQGYSPDDLGNAAGSLFRGEDWRFTGRWKDSVRVSNHRRSIRVWQLL